jgi:hypothetical protein
LTFLRGIISALCGKILQITKSKEQKSDNPHPDPPAAGSETLMGHGLDNHPVPIPSTRYRDTPPKLGGERILKSFLLLDKEEYPDLPAAGLPVVDRQALVGGEVVETPSKSRAF